VNGRNRPLIRVLIAWIACALVLVGLHFGLIAPQHQAVADGRRDVEVLTQRYTSLSEAKRPQRQEQLAAQRKQMESRLADFVFTGGQLEQLDFQLRALAEKNHLKDFSARQVRTTVKLGATELKRIAQREMLLSFTCTFPDFLRFVNELELHHPILVVDAFAPTMAVNGVDLLCTLECSLLYQTTGK
jgi:hypothetical protein